MFANHTCKKCHDHWWARRPSSCFLRPMSAVILYFNSCTLTCFCSKIMTNIRVEKLPVFSAISIWKHLERCFKSRLVRHARSSLSKLFQFNQRSIECLYNFFHGRPYQQIWNYMAINRLLLIACSHLLYLWDSQYKLCVPLVLRFQKVCFGSS